MDYDRGASWSDLVARYARRGNARALTFAVLTLYPDLRLVDVIEAIPKASSTGLRRPTPGACQTIDAGLAAIDARGPGWVSTGYPVASVVPELAEAGFGPQDIVPLFNGNVPFPALAAALTATFPGYHPERDDEAIGATLAERWRCHLPCCQPRRRWRARQRIAPCGNPPDALHFCHDSGRIGRPR